MKGFIIYLIIGLVILIGYEVIFDIARYGIQNFKTVFRHGSNSIKNEVRKLDDVERVIWYTTVITGFIAWPILIIGVTIRDIKLIKSGQLITLEEILSEDKDES